MRIPRVSPSNPGNLVEMTIANMLDEYRQQRLRVSDVVDGCLERIERLDRRGPTLNAMIVVADDARERAGQLDRRLLTGTATGPLHGVPLVIKDNINVTGLATTGGSAALRDLRPERDAVVVARLKQAGAVILGKSSMSEFAWGTYDTESSMVEGFTRNPYVLDYACGGSSGGTGVAIAAGYCMAGLGTDTGCSVRPPASINCLAGLRPTHGSISMDGVMPMNADWDTVGPLARTLGDLAVVLDVMTGAGETPGPSLRALAQGSPSPAKLGVLRQLAEPNASDTSIIGLLDQAAADFAASGATVVDPVKSDIFSLGFDSSDWYLRFRFDLDGFLDEMGEHAPLHSLTEVLDTGLVLERYRGPLQESLEWSYRPEQHPRLAQMRDIRDRYREAFLGLLETHSLDGLIFPTFRYPPVLNGGLAGERPGDEAPVGSNNYFASLTGFPALNVPMGFVEPGLPVGLQLLGRPNSETRLLQMAYGFEQYTRHRRAPTLDR